MGGTSRIAQVNRGRTLTFALNSLYSMWPTSNHWARSSRQSSKPARQAIEHDWFLLTIPTNYIKSLGEQTSCFVRFEHGYWLRQQKNQLSKRFALIGLYI